MKLFYLTSILCLLYVSALGQTNIYKYPVPDWTALKNAQERLLACEVPEAYLDTASTIDLLATFLAHPLLFEVTASNSYLVGMENLSSQIKTFQVLKRRTDFKQILFDYYRQTNPKSIMYITDDNGKVKVALQFLFLELLLANRQFIQGLSIQEQRSLTQMLLSKFEEKNQLVDSYRYFGTVGSLLSLAQVLKVNFQVDKANQVSNLDQSKLDRILDSHIGFSQEISAYILQESYNFIK